MKSFFKHFWKGALVLALFSGFLWSCEKAEKPVVPVFTLTTPSEVTIPAEGGSATITFDAPVAWKAEVKDSWVSADPSKGNAGKVTVTLRADANETGEVRSTCVTISATESEVSATVKVTQAAKEIVTPPAPEAEISLDITRKEFTAEGGTFSINVTANVAWTAVTDRDWLAVRPAEGAEGKTSVTVVAASNSEEKQKSGHVTFTAGDKTAVLEVMVAAYVPETPKAVAAITIFYPPTWSGVKLYLEAADGETPCGSRPGMEPMIAIDEAMIYGGSFLNAAIYQFVGDFYQEGKEYIMTVSDSLGNSSPAYTITVTPNAVLYFIVTNDSVAVPGDEPEEPEEPEDPNDPEMPGDVDAEGGTVLFEGEYSEDPNSGYMVGKKWENLQVSAGDIIRIKFTLGNDESYKVTEENLAQLAEIYPDYLAESGLKVGDYTGVFFFEVALGVLPTGWVACSSGPVLKDQDGCGVIGGGTIALKLSSKDALILNSSHGRFWFAAGNITVTKVVLFHKSAE